MSRPFIGLLLVLCVPDPGSAIAGVADVITLRDGQVALGLLEGAGPRARSTLLVRRDWARENLPDWFERWSSAEDTVRRRVADQRLQRLAAWKQERRPSPAGSNPIGEWIDAELADLSREDDRRSPLMVVPLTRPDIKGVKQRPKAERDLLRLGWLAGLDAPEDLERDVLKQALEDRGYVTDGGATSDLQPMLPLEAESDRRWVGRRASTEVLHDEGLRFINYQGLLLPEPVPGQPVNIAAVSEALGGLVGSLERGSAGNWSQTLRALADRGQVGAVLTRLDVSPDFSVVRVESTLWVRSGREGWNPYGSRQAAIRVDQIRPGAGANLAEDPQVKAAFGLLESFGLGTIAPEIKDRSLQVGEATRKALEAARSALFAELNGLSLPVDRVARPAPVARPGDRGNAQ